MTVRAAPMGAVHLSVADLERSVAFYGPRSGSP